MKRFILSVFLIACGVGVAFSGKVYRVTDYGADACTAVQKALEAIRADGAKGATLLFPNGRYDFRPSTSVSKELYISNHDQDNPKSVGIFVDGSGVKGFEELTIDGGGSDFIFHGRMLPIALIATKGVTVKNLAIDFEKPHIAQVVVKENDTVGGKITFEVAPWVDYQIRDNRFVNRGEGWENTITGAIAFEGPTRHMVYRSSDIDFGQRPTEQLAPNRIRIEWRNPMLVPGTVLALRNWGRPTPGILVSDAVNTKLLNVAVHYAEGMALLAQMSKNVTLDGFRVALRGESDPRYFTTQADATHFSGCSGLIRSVNGLYEGMMDDAINVHGTYLYIAKRISDNQVEAHYMHPQSWGFRWGDPGNDVQFVAPKTMEITGQQNVITAISPLNNAPVLGAKAFCITFKNPLDTTIKKGVGIENLTHSPSVVFADNVVRNNRARGALFSTPRPVLVERNLFDHTSGTAILLCGDCNGWYETGACRNVVIRQNTFINALTSMFQFTNAVISIYPEIPNLADQKKYFHGGGPGAIKIVDNRFVTFDNPILYAKSVDGLVFKNNKIERSSDYPAFHFLKEPVTLERVINYEGQDF